MTVGAELTRVGRTRVKSTSDQVAPEFPPLFLQTQRPGRTRISSSLSQFPEISKIRFI